MEIPIQSSYYVKRNLFNKFAIHTQEQTEIVITKYCNQGKKLIKLLYVLAFISA